METRGENYRRSVVNCWKKFIIFIIAIRTFIVRCIFILYASIAIWNVVMVNGSIYWLLLTTLVPLFIETFIGIQQINMDVKPKSKVSKWFSPVVFLFLVSACPPIWIMELTIASNTTENVTVKNSFISTNKPQVFPTTLGSINLTQTTIPVSSIVSTVNETNSTWRNVENYNNTNVTASELETNITNNVANETDETMPLNITGTANLNTTLKPINTSTNANIYIFTRNLSDVYFYTMSDIKRVIEQKGGDIIKKIESMWSHFDIPYRTTILEQIILLTLIICRWILPRGGITRDQLSQLLLVNIGMAADILDLFDAIKEKVVRHNILLNVIILFLWQMSLFQFSLIKTVTKARKVRVGFFDEYSSKSNTESKIRITNCICCRTELWAIATSLFLQDIPFFCFRMSLIFRFNVLSYSNVFFTCKNSLIILLQLFRSYVIFTGKSDDDKILESTLSRQSLVIGSVTRWNHVHGSSEILDPPFDNRKPLFTDQYELAITNRSNGDIPEFLPKASPEQSISSKDHMPIGGSLNSIPSINNNKSDI